MNTSSRVYCHSISWHTWKERKLASQLQNKKAMIKKTRHQFNAGSVFLLRRNYAKEGDFYPNVPKNICICCLVLWVQWFTSVLRSLGITDGIEEEEEFGLYRRYFSTKMTNCCPLFLIMTVKISPSGLTAAGIQMSSSLSFPSWRPGPGVELSGGGGAPEPGGGWHHRVYIRPCACQKWRWRWGRSTSVLTAFCGKTWSDEDGSSDSHRRDGHVLLTMDGGKRENWRHLVEW